MCRVQCQQKKVYVLASYCLPKKAKEFVDRQLALTWAKKHGEWYTPEQINMALRLYHHSLRYYTEIKSTFWLPSTATLSRHLMGSLGGFEVENFTRGNIQCSYWWATGSLDHIYWLMQKNRKLKQKGFTYFGYLKFKAWFHSLDFSLGFWPTSRPRQ